MTKQSFPALPDTEAGEPSPIDFAAKQEHTRTCQKWNPDEGYECTCALDLRIALQTEREMHNAWRKRAEEAELASLRSPAVARKEENK